MDFKEQSIPGTRNGMEKGSEVEKKLTGSQIKQWY